jgi:DNA gyrase subunit A
MSERIWITATGRAFIQADRGMLNLEADDPLVAVLPAADGTSGVLAFSRSGICFRLPSRELAAEAKFLTGVSLAAISGFQPSDPLVAAFGRDVMDPDSTAGMAYRSGTVKRTLWRDFSAATAAGIAAAKPATDDQLQAVVDLPDRATMLLVGSNGKVTRFQAGDVRPTGRAAYGVRGMRLPAGEEVRLALAAGDQAELLIVNNTGAAKRVPLADIPVKGRGGAGVVLTKSDRKYGTPALGALTGAGAVLTVQTRSGRVEERSVAAVAVCGRAIVPKQWPTGIRAQAVFVT